MAPDLAFEVIQATTGEAMFFSIGTDRVFYVTREVSDTATGWNRVDLSSVLSPQFSGASIAAKSFAIAQNPQTQAFDIALVVTVAGVDHLYLSLGNSGVSAAWSGGISWMSVPFDASGISPPSPLTVDNVYLLRIPNGSSSVESCFVDIVRTPGDPFQQLDRYYILPTSSPHWNRHALAIELSAGSIQSCLGNRTDDFVPGIYTFGSISGTQELIFVPQSNAFRPNIAPAVSRLNLPAGATSIASALSPSGVTSLFVASSSGLYFFPPDSQSDGAVALKLMTTSVFAGVSNLAASTTDSRTAVWGLNAQGQLYYTSCPAGSEKLASSWTLPIPICSGAENFAFYLNAQTSNNRNLLIPATAVDDVVEYYSFSTHIQVTDANGAIVPNASISLSVATPAVLYINDTYYSLSPTSPVKVAADATGILTVVQETQSLQGSCFRVTLTSSPSVFADVNPMSKAIQTLSSIKSADHLSNVQITTSSGTTQPLISSSVSADVKNQAASAITQLVQVYGTLPANGSTQAAPTVMMERSVSLKAANVFGISISGGDLIQWAKDLGNDITNFVVQEIDGLWHLALTIAGEVYNAVIDSLSAVAGALQFVFDKLEVAFDDLVAWLGFLFQWDDILRTHKVIKNVFKLFARQMISQLPTVQAKMQTALGQLESKVNGWANINDPGESALNAQTSTTSQLPGANTPQANWGLQQTKGNFNASSTTFSPSSTITGDAQQILSQLEQMVSQEAGNFENMVNQVKSQIVDQIYTLTPVDVIKKLGAIIADLLLNTVETVCSNVLQLFGIIANTLLDVLDAPLNIPVISSLYKKISGDDLSFLDLICLISAIPATIVSKLATGNTLFPDNSTTSALINATDFNNLTSLLRGGQQVSVTKLAVAASASNQTKLAASLSPADNANAALNIIALVGSGAFNFCTLLKSNAPPGAVPTPVLIATFVSYLAFVAPSLTTVWGSTTGWAVDMNDIVTFTAICKAYEDVSMGNNPAWVNGASPVIDCILNLAWLASGIDLYVISNHKTSDKWSFSGAIFFDVGGILAPATSSQFVPKDVAEGVLLGTIVLNQLYGLCCAEGGFALLKGE
ncbi:hypothetical protein K435DRAFT_965130 [Dendrothele bispora CBS 962.96]|uniref:Uncharacterized protein n=2 Tax=Dendrothele bispora (strain CBS 962.96) TaxID=1314807 RepID=A0A4S8M707_DENBC|nr:hypothetical protein K435DRAFT_965130 [Dendrothele bispora CBS 962.96]